MIERLGNLAKLIGSFMTQIRLQTADEEGNCINAEALI